MTSTLNKTNALEHALPPNHGFWGRITALMLNASPKCKVKRRHEALYETALGHLQRRPLCVKSTIATSLLCRAPPHGLYESPQRTRSGLALCNATWLKPSNRHRQRAKNGGPTGCASALGSAEPLWAVEQRIMRQSMLCRDVLGWSLIRSTTAMARLGRCTARVKAESITHQ